MKLGWMSVRKVPVSNKPNAKERSKHYFEILQNFFSKYRLCKVCKGAGYTVKTTRKVDTTNIKFSDIEDLENLHENPESSVILSDLIREVISFELEGRSPCKKCRGMKFVKRSAK